MYLHTHTHTPHLSFFPPFFPTSLPDVKIKKKNVALLQGLFSWTISESFEQLFLTDWNMVGKHLHINGISLLAPWVVMAEHAETFTNANGLQSTRCASSAPGVKTLCQRGQGHGCHLQVGQLGLCWSTWRIPWPVSQALSVSDPDFAWFLTSASHFWGSHCDMRRNLQISLPILVMIYVYTSNDQTVGSTDMGSVRSILHRKDNLWFLNRETVTGEGRGLGEAET